MKKILQVVAPVMVILVIVALFIIVLAYGDNKKAMENEEVKTEVNKIENLKAEEYDKVEIWLNDECCTLAEQEIIGEFINILQSKKMVEREVKEDKDGGKDGYAFLINFYKGDTPVVRIRIGGGADVNVYGEVDGKSVSSHYDLDYSTYEEKYQDIYDFFDAYVED